MDSTSDDRTNQMTCGERKMPDEALSPTPGNNVMRHAYKPLTDEDKGHMMAIKDAGLSFHELCDRLGPSREISLAKTKIEEAVFWAVKHVTK